MDYFIHLAVLCGIALILSQSFNLTFGLGRLLNLAHIASYALGAYTTALLSTELERSVWICLPAGMAVSGFFALIIGGISLRLSGDYFALGTLAFNSVVTALLINWKSLTRGVLGIPGIPRPEIGAIDFYNNTNFLILVVIFDVITLAVLWCVFRGRLGRSLRAQAEDEYLSLTLGKNTRGIRNDSFILASTFAGLAGGLFAYYINYVDPSMFNLNEMVFVLSTVVVGRPGSFWGVCVATIFLVLLPEPLRFVEIPSDILGPMRQLLQALILFGAVYWNRATLFPPERKV